MKKSFLFSAILLIAAQILTMSCGGGDDGPGPDRGTTVTVVPEVINAGAEAATLTLKVTADVDWAVRCDADWVTLRPSGGLKNVATDVQVLVKANTAMDDRATVVEVVAGGKVLKSVAITQGIVSQASASVSRISMGGQASKSNFKVTANAQWTLSTQADWLTITPTSGGKGETDVEVVSTENTGSTDRTATITLSCGDTKSEITVSQMSDTINAPEGYSLVWDDEFNGNSLGSDWVLENWPAGYVNNELQIYTSKPVDGKYTYEVKGGFLNIICFKANDGKVYSARMNALPSKGWLYGYFEARIKLPKGKGTWPAFWMMPCNVDWNTNGWPKCGEIDIMEEVGANPNYVSSSLHTENYNHTKGTQKTHEMYCAGAEEDFHVYALEWTADEITTYVDGKVQLKASKAAMGSDHASWPFHYAFYPILNLAWGGDWGGYKGVDDSALPATMQIDYVRIFQKQ